MFEVVEPARLWSYGFVYDNLKVPVVFPASIYISIDIGSISWTVRTTEGGATCVGLPRSS